MWYRSGVDRALEVALVAFIVQIVALGIRGAWSLWKLPRTRDADDGSRPSK